MTRNDARAMPDASLIRAYRDYETDAFARNRGCAPETDADDPEALARMLVIEMGQRAMLRGAIECLCCAGRGEIYNAFRRSMRFFGYCEGGAL